METGYREDLAYIHDVGHSDYALKSAPGIVSILEQNNIRDGLVVDLGCGSGLSASQLVSQYQVLGIDLSEALIAIARARVPQAEFRVESLFTADIPPCNAVISIGECFNYLFDGDHTLQTLGQRFNGIYCTLMPGGVLIFDVAEPGRVPLGQTVKGFSEGKDWTVLVEKQEAQSTLTRRIITFRQVGDCYRRDEEVHRQRLYQAEEVTEKLRQSGFEVEVMRCYGAFELPKAHAAFVARKPA